MAFGQAQELASRNDCCHLQLKQVKGTLPAADNVDIGQITSTLVPPMFVSRLVGKHVFTYIYIAQHTYGLIWSFSPLYKNGTIT